jgi:predicted RNA-binding protein YlxR (DUF448 family)
VKPKHSPIRTCVACRSTDEKRDLLRVVRQPDGGVLYDPKGKLSGRGAYVCAQPECIALARKQKRLERSLKVSALSDELFTELNARAVALMATASNGKAEGAPGAAPPPPVDAWSAPLVAPSGQESEAENA